MNALYLCMRVDSVIIIRLHLHYFFLLSATVLITGGSTGLGLGFVPLFLAAGSRVVIVARHLSSLNDAQANYPSIGIMQGDVETCESREKLFNNVMMKHPDVNIVMNNAGIQRQNDALAKGPQAPWSERQSEIDINFGGVVHMSTLFVPHLLTKHESAIINVSSGLAFYPAAGMAVYSATKAAVHSYTMSLRYQLANTSVRVIELIPPAVRSRLGDGHHDFGIDTDVYCRATFERFINGEVEIGYKAIPDAMHIHDVDEARTASRSKVQHEMERLANMMNVPQVTQL